MITASTQDTPPRISTAPSSIFELWANVFRMLRIDLLSLLLSAFLSVDHLHFTLYSLATQDHLWTTMKPHYASPVVRPGTESSYAVLSLCHVLMAAVPMSTFTWVMLSTRPIDTGSGWQTMWVEGGYASRACRLRRLDIPDDIAKSYILMPVNFIVTTLGLAWAAFGFSLLSYVVLIPPFLLYSTYSTRT